MRGDVGGDEIGYLHQTRTWRRMTRTINYSTYCEIRVAVQFCAVVD